MLNKNALADSILTIFVNRIILLSFHRLAVYQTNPIRLQSACIWVAETMTAFEEFGVLPEIAKAIDEMEWTLPTDVQAEAIPLILTGGDVLMAAETGSGKTGAFCLPILQTVWETLRDIRDGKSKGVSKVAGTSTSSSVWKMSVYDRNDAMAITPDGLRCQSREFKDWHGCRATYGVYGRGKYFFEAIVFDEGLCRVGWSTQSANLDLGTDRFSFGFGGTGKKSHNRQFDDYGEAFGKGDIITCLLDLERSEVSFLKNGLSLGTAFRINDNLRNETFYPAVVLKNAEIQFNFGDEPFKYNGPAGYVACAKVDSHNCKANVIAASSSVQTLQPKPNAPKAIIIEPSRELAEQTFEQIGKFKKYLKDPQINELLVVGRAPIREQIDALKSGVDIVVATPGRLEELINSEHILLTHCRFFVLDEADGLLKANFGNLIENIHKRIPKITSDSQRLQMIVCSATLHAFEVKKMADKLMHFPTWVDLKGEDAVPETVHHVVTIVDPQSDTTWHNSRQHVQTDGVHAKDGVRPGTNTPECFSEAIKILKGEYCLRAINENKMDRAIIFCRTKLDCDNLERYFKQVNASLYSCVCLHGDRKPQERKQNLEMFKNNEKKFLICTDVAARGIDISGLPFMINVTLPDEKSNYVHRIGRVGRAERMGLAISLVSSVPEKVWYHGEWCSSRGRNCSNTGLIADHPKGCCTWLNEKAMLADIEDHLNITITQIDKEMKVPVNEFDGKVVYGEKRKTKGTDYKDHVQQLQPVVQKLGKLESSAQLAYLKRMKLY